MPSSTVLFVDFSVVAAAKRGPYLQRTQVKTKKQREKYPVIACQDPFCAHVGILTSSQNKPTLKRILPLQGLGPPGRYYQVQLVKIQISGHLLRINMSYRVYFPPNFAIRISQRQQIQERHSSLSLVWVFTKLMFPLKFSATFMFLYQKENIARGTTDPGY